MQFKHPEYLYFLGLILIPILVHLFQLQKFKKTPFSNVAFLKKITLQTRKSSKLKKWLILSTRVLLISALVFAFSQPYNSTKNSNLKPHTFIYLDNSLSLNGKEKKGNLLQNSIKEIIANLSSEENYSLLTNSSLHKNISSNQLKNTLLNITPEAENQRFEQVMLKINKFKKTKTNTLVKSVLISDFQNYKKNDFTNVTSQIQLIQTKPTSKNNLSIEGIDLENTSDSNFILSISIRNQGAEKLNIPVALYNNQTIFAKQTFSIKENTLSKVTFTIQNKKLFTGKITLEYEDAYTFDNDFYFTINSTKKTAIFNIGNAPKFISRIYPKNEFIFNNKSLKNINYNTLEKQELIILNELNEIPNNLATFLTQHLAKNKSVVIIPSSNININSYNDFFRMQKTGYLQKLRKDSLRITEINFSIPFFKNVFSKKVKNFQYPMIKSFFISHFKNSIALLKLENQQNFIEKLTTKTGNLYWFSSSLNSKNGNFKNSPLIVPLFYRFGKLSTQFAKPYYFTQQRNTFDISVDLKKNEIVSIKNEVKSFIPLQQASVNKVTITTTEKPIKNGFYTITTKEQPIETIAYNYSSKESNLDFLNIKELAKSNKNIKSYDTISSALLENSEKNKVTWLWKWFLTLAIVSLLFEILILKFFKP